MDLQEEIIAIPKYGFKQKLNNKYPLKWCQEKVPTFSQIWKILPLILRYLWYWIKIKWQGRRLIMDYIHLENSKQIYGVPIGGIGSGTIGRGYKGEFCRYQLRPGLYEYQTIDANQFIITIRKNDMTVFQSLLSTFQKTSKHLNSWKSEIDASKCKYTGLYPRSWTEYELKEFGLKLVCRQISPVIPHNYKDSSLPCAVFVWSINSTNEEALSVTITFTFKNGIGVPSVDKDSTSSSKPFTYLGSEGVILYQTIDKTPCSYSLAVKSQDGVNVTKCLHFDPKSNGKLLWNKLWNNGGFDAIVEKKHDHIFGEMGIALAANFQIGPNSTKNIDFSLVWDMPIVQFFCKKKKYTKYYTKLFGVDAPLKIIDYALNNYKDWELAIYNWQKPILDDQKIPDWFKSALFNETYFVSDGGSCWFTLNEEESKKLPQNDPRVKYGRFGYLEGHEYRMYNTYDVHFYASFALAVNWPALQLCIQYDFKDAIFEEDTAKFKELYGGTMVERKVKDSVPHDLGDPGEEAFSLINAYPIHDVSEWRDLNTKFVLQVFRDYSLIADKIIDGKQYLQDMFKALKVIMDKTKQFDVDNDGLIENSGNPDETYDTWVMTGPSAYCGGLWLGALFAMVNICDILGKQEEKDYYNSILENGIKSFDSKLWNGKCYNFDTTERSDGDIYMADQLCGFWYLKSSGHNYEVFPKEKVSSALKTIFENNVKSCCDGQMGAINGFTSKGCVDTSTLQSEEIWTGVTYALAATMLFEGMEKEAWETAGPMHQFLWEKIGLAFETPEALYCKDNYRAIGYMRPLSIWSMYLALRRNSAKL